MNPIRMRPLAPAARAGAGATKLDTTPAAAAAVADVFTKSRRETLSCGIAEIS
jgi:hypothetical protein